MPLRCQPDAEPIPGYRLIAPLGDGGFGEIWKCRTPEGRLRALKVVTGDLAAADSGRRTAEQELHGLRKMAGLRNPALLTPERFDVCDGQLLILMELADGSLSDRFRECRHRGLPGIPREELLGYLADAAEGLDALREAQLQHLDVKAQNLLLVAGRAMVGDFGLVRDLRAGGPGAGASPAYSAPETFDDRLSPHCDQYSLAIVYQELLTGARPFVGTTAEQLADAHLNAEPNLAPLPPADRAAVARALAKKPSRRFPSCAAFVRAIREPGTDNFDEGSRRQSAIHGPEAAFRPTVVIGLGGMGGAVVGALRRMLGQFLRPRESWPVRFLYIDSDAEAVRSAVESGALAAAEVLPARLKPPAHYSKLQATRKKAAPNGWFEAGWLTRLTESATADGCRGLGRLAYADHAKAVAERLDADVTALGRSATSPPRVVIVTGLAGGAGGGMVYDVAYLARHLLGRSGGAVHVSGWLLLPSVDASDERALANTFAALAELRHFNRLDTTYRGPGHEPGERFSTTDPPFDDVVVLSDAATAAAGLLRELRTPVTDQSSTVDECRTFGETRSVWPRQQVLHQAARRLAAELVRRWSDGPAIPHGLLLKWVAEQWAALRLGPESLSEELRRTVAAHGPATTDGVAALAAAATGLVREWSTRLARLPATLMEQPGLRLAAAETAVRLLAERVQSAVERAGPAVEQVNRKFEAAGSADPAATIRWRYHALVLCQVAAIYAALRTPLAEQLAEIELCRRRLREASKSFADNGCMSPTDDNLLLPPGCETIADAADKLLAGMNAVPELDRQSQQSLADSTGGLTRACLADDDLLEKLGPTLIHLAESYLASQMTDRTAELFMAHHADPVAALKGLWESAVPVLAPSAETTAVFGPPELAYAAREAFGPGVTFTATADEIAVVRRSCMPFAVLPHLGPAAKTAYQRRKAAGDSPHARVDVIFASD